MTDRLAICQKALLDVGNECYDEEIGLTGKYPVDFFTPQILEKFFDGALLSSTSLHPYRESLAYALLLLIAGQEKRSVSRILESFCRHAPDQGGKLKWFYEEKLFRDGNGTFFSIEPLLLIEHCYGDQLEPALREKVLAVLKKSYPLFKHECQVSSLTYVNPTLAAYTFTALLAEKFYPEEFPAALAEFQKYLAFLKENGIAENYTTTYLLVDSRILMCALIASRNDALKATAQDLLENVILTEAAFFGNRFPAPFRRGYNGYYKTRRDDILAYLLNWSDELPTISLPDQSIAVAVISLYAQFYPLNCLENQQFPRELTQTLYADCNGMSYLDRKFLLGAFDKYPSTDNVVWQCVTTGGSGWQDGPVYATFENSAASSMILRLEAVDGDGNFQCHPYEGDFSMNKIQHIFPWRSFPPEPKIRTLLKKNNLLCLTKIDLVDAVLQKLGFNLHFSRFNGKLLNLDGQELGDGVVNGPVIAILEDIFVYLHPLRRVDMAGGSLYDFKGFVPPQFTIRRAGETLDLSMYNLDVPQPELCTQNHAFGGFFMRVEAAGELTEFLRRMRAVQISDISCKNRINACIDERDAIRTVKVDAGDTTLNLTWDHYSRI